MADSGGGFQLQWVMSALNAISQALGNLQQTLASVFPQASSKVVATATAGAAGAPPADVAGYLTVTVDGTPYKIPLFNP